ncbi:MAG: ubiquitin-like small modifier protein 1 [Candidatus Thermoplasmatota archaeon]
MVFVRFYGHFREITKEKEIEVKAKSLENTIKILIKKYPELKNALLSGNRIKPYVKVMVNGQDINILGKMKTKLNEKDEVVIFPPVGGG